MNANKRSAKTTVLIAALVVCALCLVTVAYAYNASYNTSVDEKDVAYSSEIGYVVINSDDGLKYTSDTVQFSVNAVYKTETTDTTNSTDTTSTTVYTRDTIDFPDSEYYTIVGNNDSETFVMTVPMGSVTLKNNSSAQVIAGLTQSVEWDTSELDNIYAFDMNATSSLVFKDSSSNEVSNVTIAANGSVELTVYLKAQVNSAIIPVKTTTVSTTGATTSGSVPSLTGFDYDSETHIYSGTVYFNPISRLTVGITDSVEFGNTLTAEQVSSLKSTAAKDSNTTVTLKDNGVTMTLNAAAIQKLSSESENTVFDASVDSGNNKYTLTLKTGETENTFGDTDSRLTITASYNGIGDAAVYYNGDNPVSFTDATVNGDRTVTFVTNHLSEYRIMSKDSEDLTSAATIALGDDLTITYTSVQNAVKYVNDGETVTVLSGIHRMGQGGTSTNTEDNFRFIKDTVGASNLTMVGQAGAVLHWEPIDAIFHGSDELNSVSLTNITIETGDILTSKDNKESAYHEYFDTASITMTNCTIKGMYTQYASKAVFTNCTFDSGDAGKNFWSPIYADNADVTFDNCTFNSKEYALNVYSESSNYTDTRSLTLTDCKFNCTGTSTDDIRSAVRVKTSGGDGAVLNLTITDCTVSGHKDYSSTETNVYYTYDTLPGLLTITKEGDNKLTVNAIIDGVQVYGKDVNVVPVYLADDLQTVASLVNAGTKNYLGVTVKLMNDIDLKGVEWTPIGTYWHEFNGKFDGNGCTISNLTYSSNSEKCAGFIGVMTYGTITDLTMRNVNIQGSGWIGSIVAYTQGYGGASITNCTVDGAILTSLAAAQVGGIVGLENGGTIVSNNTVRNATLSGYAVGGIAGCGGLTDKFVNNKVEGTNTFTVKASSIDQGYNAAGGEIIGFIQSGTLDSSNTASGVTLSYDGFEAKIGEVYYSTIDGALSAATSNCTINVLQDVSATNNVSASNITFDGPAVITVVVQGSSFTNCTFNNVVLQKMSNISYTTTDCVLNISEASTLLNFAKATTQNYTNGYASFYSGVTVELQNDIDLKGIDWVPIGSNTSNYNTTEYTMVHSPTGFKGVFDGNGYTISNMNCVSTAKNSNSTAGFFAVACDGATIKDIVFDNCTAKSYHYAAVVCAYSSYGSLTISKCTVKNSSVTSEYFDSKGGYPAGGIVGLMNDSGSITDCTVQDTVINGVWRLGGIAGVGDKISITNNTVKGITFNLTVIDGFTTDGKQYDGLVGLGTADSSSNTVDGVTVNSNTSS